MKALVLDAHASAAVAAVQSLGRRGVEVHAVADAECLAHRSRHLAKWLTLPRLLDPQGVIAWVREVDSKENYDLIIPTTEAGLHAMQRCDDDDPLRRRAVLPSGLSVATALDKTRTWRLARELGIPVPAATIIDRDSATPDPVGYPVVLKTPTSLVECDGELVYSPVCIARSSAARDAFLERWLPYTPVQQMDYVAGHGWAVECLYSHGELKWMFAHERLHELPLAGGASSYRRSVEVPGQLREYTRRLLDRLDWHGVAMVEFRGDADGHFVLLEVNPRLWGSLPLAIRSGVDFPWGLYLLATGRDPGRQPVYQVHRYMRNLSFDLEWMRANWIADHHDERLLTRGRTQSVLEWLRPMVGRESWDHFDWADPGPTFSQMAAVVDRLRQVATSRVGARIRARDAARRHRRNLRHLEHGGQAVRRLTFVCHGNICRSPFAENLAKAALPGRIVESSGLHEQAGRRTPERIGRLAREFGVDLAVHRSRCLSDEQVRTSDCLLIMDQLNYTAMLKRFPSSLDKILFLGMFCSPQALEIADPFNLVDADARRSLAQICRAIAGLADWLGRRSG